MVLEEWDICTKPDVDGVESGHGGLDVRRRILGDDIIRDLWVPADQGECLALDGIELAGDADRDGGASGGGEDVGYRDAVSACVQGGSWEYARASPPDIVPTLTEEGPRRGSRGKSSFKMSARRVTSVWFAECPRWG